MKLNSRRFWRFERLSFISIVIFGVVLWKYSLIHGTCDKMFGTSYFSSEIPPVARICAAHTLRGWRYWRKYSWNSLWGLFSMTHRLRGLFREWPIENFRNIFANISAHAKCRRLNFWLQGLFLIRNKMRQKFCRKFYNFSKKYSLIHGKCDGWIPGLITSNMRIWKFCLILFMGIRFWKWLYFWNCVGGVCVGVSLSKSTNVCVFLCWSFWYVKLGVLFDFTSTHAISTLVIFNFWSVSYA